MPSRNEQPPLSASSRSSGSSVLWFVIGLIILGGIGFYAYHSHTSLPNATTTAGTNSTGINSADGTTSVSPVSAETNRPRSPAGPSTDDILKAAESQQTDDGQKTAPSSGTTQ